MMRLFMVLLLSLALALAAACGNGGEEESAPGGTASPDGEAAGATPGPDAPVVSVGSASLAVGEGGSVDLEVTGFPAPGLGAWTIDIAYDPAVITVVDCPAFAGSVCNPEYDDTTVRVAGAAAFGHEGDTVLASVEFTCAAAGSSPLAIAIDVLADATVGDPQPVVAAIEDGEITCAEEEEAPPPTAE